MATLKANVQFTCTEPGLTSEEKLEAIQNECQQTLYTDEDYDEAVYGKWISIFDAWMWVEDAEERNKTSLDPLYLEEWIDVELLCRVRQLHQWIKVPSSKEIENFSRLDDVMTIDNHPRDRKKFAVMKVSRDWNGIRKVIWNEEGNFEEWINPDDNPDWLNEMLNAQDKIDRANKLEHKTKILWKAIKDSRAEYKKCYSLMERYQANWLTSYANKYKRKWDEAYKEYLTYSRAMDKVKELDAKIDNSKLKREADTLLHLFVEMQQKCPDKYVDSVTREDIKDKYAKEWYEKTRYFLKRLVNRAEELAYLETA